MKFQEGKLHYLMGEDKSEKVQLQVTNVANVQVDKVIFKVLKHFKVHVCAENI